MILLTEGESMSRLFDLDWQLLADSTDDHSHLFPVPYFELFSVQSCEEDAERP